MLLSTHKHSHTHTHTHTPVTFSEFGEGGGHGGGGAGREAEDIQRLQEGFFAGRASADPSVRRQRAQGHLFRSLQAPFNFLIRDEVFTWGCGKKEHESRKAASHFNNTVRTINI